MSTNQVQIDLPLDVMLLLDDIAATGVEVYLVGGAVRDYFRTGRTAYADFDIAHNGNIPTLIAALETQGYHVVETGLDFGVFQVNLSEGRNVDVAGFRAESYTPESRKPNTTPVQTVEEDLARRDFTFNAVALRFIRAKTDAFWLGKFQVIDPYNGLADLKAGIVKAVGNPRERFEDDPLRMLRALRFAARYNFTIDSDTLKTITEMA